MCVNGDVIVRDRKGALKKKKKILSAFSRHLSFWVSGVESPLFILKNKKKTKYNFT